jgi:hypothetical protein
MKKYTECQNTPTRLFKRLLLANIKAVDIAAANMLNPHEEYPLFVELMKKLKKGYK